MTFKKLNKIKNSFKNVKELVLSSNNCNDFENLDVNLETFPNLENLDLSDNKIESIELMNTWKDIKLDKLNIADNLL